MFDADSQVPHSVRLTEALRHLYYGFGKFLEVGERYCDGGCLRDFWEEKNNFTDSSDKETRFGFLVNPSRRGDDMSVYKSWQLDV